MNDYYSKMIHFYNPPTRVCVECPLPNNLHVILEAVAYRPETEGNFNACIIFVVATMILNFMFYFV